MYYMENEDIKISRWLDEQSSYQDYEDFLAEEEYQNNSNCSYPQYMDY